MTSKTSVIYTVGMEPAGARRFKVRCDVSRQLGDGAWLFRMPAWIRGSYLIRDLAKHVFDLRAYRKGLPVQIERIDKSSFRIPAGSGSARIEYQVHASDPSVRKAFLNDQRGFFNGSSLFYCPEALRQFPMELCVEAPKAHENWKIATSMKPIAIDAQGFGRYWAENYDELIDHPFEIGTFSRHRFEVDAIPHELVLAGRNDADADVDRVVSDLERICTAQREMFGREPMLDNYLFLTNVVNMGYGGLEHRASCALICCRNDFPRVGDPAQSGEYRNFLGLCSHEYFHLWNVKRITAERFKSSDLSREAYSEDLWHYEGVTSYYDDLFLLRSGCVDVPTYLDLLAQTATRVQRSPAQHRQSLAEASFETWIKFYQPDDNSLNVNANYYSKGALMALCLDLTLRRDSQVTLDAVMQTLWKRYGQSGEGVPEGGLAAVAQEISGLDLTSFFSQALYSTGELPFSELLALFGISAERRASTSPIDIGGRTLATARACWTGLRMQTGSMVVTHVMDDSPAQDAGLCVDDELVALDALKLTPQQWHKQLELIPAGRPAQLHYFRDNELRSVLITPIEHPMDTWTLVLAEIKDKEIAARRKAWLGV